MVRTIKASDLQPGMLLAVCAGGAAVVRCRVDNGKVTVVAKWPGLLNSYLYFARDAAVQVLQPAPAAPQGQHVADICLYGNDSVGHGYIISLQGSKALLGDGTPVKDRTALKALLFAATEVAMRVPGKGSAQYVWVYAPDGTRKAPLCLDLNRSFPDSFDQLPWQAAEVYVVNAETLQTASLHQQLQPGQR